MVTKEARLVYGQRVSVEVWGSTYFRVGVPSSVRSSLEQSIH